MSASPARRIAFEVLRRVQAEGAYASDLLHSKLAEGLSRADAGLATELTMGVLRWQRLLDFLLGPALDRPGAKLDVEVLTALRMGLYQMRFLDRVPVSAAVSESVELVKGARKRSAAPLVNAVLRKMAPEAKAPATEIEARLPAAASEAEHLGILTSHPTWLVERWLARFGRERTSALLEANNRPPRLCCAVVDPQAVERASQTLRAEGLVVGPGRWLKAALSVSGGNVANAKALQSGMISIQDEASQMVARLLHARAGDVVLDLCAAPGGKAGTLGRAVAPDGLVIAGDIHQHRLRSARTQMERTQTTGVCWLALDATQPLPFCEPFPRVLVDAPCSGTGTLARNPEIRWRLQPDDLSRTQCRQSAMLREALGSLARGGRLVYATCSMEPEENEQVVREAASQDAGLRMVGGEVALAPWLVPGADAARLFDEDGFFRTFPPETGTDGFFAAVLERRA